MAAKVGGIYVSLALNTAEFSGGVDKSVAEMRKFDKLQSDMERAMNRVNNKMGRQAVIVGQLALSNLKLGPTISLVATHAQQYYRAMERAAAGNAAFSKSGAGLSAVMKSISANWMTLTVQVAKISIDAILKQQLDKAQKIADKAREAADRMDKRTAEARTAWEKDLQDKYDRAAGIEHKITIATIAEEARRTKDYRRGRQQADRLIAEARYQSEADANIKIYKDAVEREKQAAAARKEEADRLQKHQKELAKAIDEEFADFDESLLEMDKKRLSVAEKIVAAWKEQVTYARQLAGLVVGRGTGAYNAMLGSAEAFGRIPLPAGLPGGMMQQSPAMNFDTKEMNEHLRIIAEAARKELRL